MASFIDTYHFDIGQFDAIAPIPLFPSRFRERGYNQSQLLSQEIVQKYRINLSTTNLIRTRNTEHQTLLCEKERWTNIDGAFRIRNPSEFRGKNILIIDDLLTTGATASEAARTLKDAGAKTVGILTLAITA
jgi:competence protein ComFC